MELNTLKHSQKLLQRTNNETSAHCGFLFILPFSTMEAQSFLRILIETLVDNTDAIEITEKQDELGTLLSLKVAPEDMGIIIGRAGKTIDSLRTVLRVF